MTTLPKGIVGPPSSGLAVLRSLPDIFEFPPSRHLITVTSTPHRTAHSSWGVNPIEIPERNARTVADRGRMIARVILVVAALMASTSGDATAIAHGEDVCESQAAGSTEDRLWLLDVRSQPSDVCRVRLPARPTVKRIDPCGRTANASFDEYLGCQSEGRPRVIYVHGNRMSASGAIERGLYVYRRSAARCDGPIDWVIWSWPSDREGILGHDVRIKADRTDGQGLLLADVLRHHAGQAGSTTLIGFSFGGRVISGALHALAGGALAGYGLPGDSVEGANFRAGMIAPAIAQDWMAPGGYHQLATRNLESIAVLYNRRDAILKRYWLIDRVRGQMALGYGGPRRFAARVDGSPLPVESRDCSPVVGLQHDERDYYEAPCSAGREISSLIRMRANQLMNPMNVAAANMTAANRTANAIADLPLTESVGD